VSDRVPSKPSNSVNGQQTTSHIANKQFIAKQNNITMLRFLQLMYQHYNTLTIDGSILQAFDSALLMYKFYIIYFRITNTITAKSEQKNVSPTHVNQRIKKTMDLKPKQAAFHPK
jgi:hypothetical protein